MRLTRRTAVELAGGLGTVGLAGCLGSGETAETSGTTDGSDTDSTQWFETELEDIRSGESFQLAEFDQPVVIHMFAIWCSKCDAQERQIATLRAENDAFAMVSVNVDPNEDDEAVLEHANSNGYEWNWVTPPTAFTDSLVDEFGTSITHPPSVPKVLLCPDGSFRRLEGGVQSASDVESELGTC